MALSKKMTGALSAQVGMEFEAAYGYLAMSTWLEGQNLPGFAKWMRHQAKEEVEHAMRLVKYLMERGGALALPAVGSPKGTFASPLAVAKAALGNEKKVSASINALYELAAKEGDHPTGIVLQWFITEQVEEEDSMETLIATLERADSGSALLAVDAQLGSRAG